MDDVGDMLVVERVGGGRGFEGEKHITLDLLFENLG